MLREARGEEREKRTGKEGEEKGDEQEAEEEGGGRDSDLEAAGALLGEEDWLLGVFDAVGEMMRWAITAMATGGDIPGSIVAASPGSGEGEGAMDVDGASDAKDAGGTGRNMVVDMRDLRARLEILNTKGSGMDREVGKKMEVMRACVDKVEATCYGMIVRGRERPKGWVPGEEGPRGEAVEGY